MAATVASESVLSQDLLARMAVRCADYDRENRFFHEDFARLWPFMLRSRPRLSSC
jgi:hypothetical protein